MTPQSPVSQTLYAQLLEEASIFNATIFEQGIAGSPYLNHANGYAYWYWQVSTPDGKLKRLSLGRDTPETHSLVECLKTRKAEAITAQSSRPGRVSTGLVDGALPNWPAQQILRSSIGC